MYIINSDVYLLFRFEASEYASKGTELLLCFADMCLVETFLLLKNDDPHVHNLETALEQYFCSQNVLQAVPQATLPITKIRIGSSCYPAKVECTSSIH
jgi:hypothetical protein